MNSVSVYVFFCDVQLLIKDLFIWNKWLECQYASSSLSLSLSFSNSVSIVFPTNQLPHVVAVADSVSFIDTSTEGEGREREGINWRQGICVLNSPFNRRESGYRSRVREEPHHFDIASRESHFCWSETFQSSIEHHHLQAFSAQNAFVRCENSSPLIHK